MTDIASAVGVLDVSDGGYTDRHAAVDVAVFMVLVTVLLVVGGCVL